MDAKVVTYHEICENCVDFSPHLRTETFFADCTVVSKDMIIYCDHDDICRRTIERYKQFQRNAEVK